MKTKRKTWYLQKKDILYVEENHDGKYGAKGQKRLPKRKTTPEDIQRVNRWNKSKKAKIRLMEYFSPGDLWATYTYKPENRPPDMDTAKKQFLAVMDKLRKIYRKRGRELFWIRNIERGTKGALAHPFCHKRYRRHCQPHRKSLAIRWGVCNPDQKE